MTTAQTDLVRRTYDALMDVRTSRNVEAGRTALRALREEAESTGQNWDAIRNLALVFDLKANG